MKLTSRLAGNAERQNGSYFFDGQAVHDDTDGDVLTGSAETDWFFHDPTRDVVTDK